MNKKLYAFYRESLRGNYNCRIEDCHKSKKDYAQEMRGNGYRVIEILSDKQIKEIIESYKTKDDNIDNWKKHIDLERKYNEMTIEYIVQILS